MMNELVFATGNLHKVSEVKHMIASAGLTNIAIKSLIDLEFEGDIAETADTFRGNALLKANHILATYNKPCFAEDSGLVVPILDGAPGVYSARYAGVERNDVANYQLLLENLKDNSNRQAYFQTAIAYVDGTQVLFFDGKIYGSIVDAPKGSNGFGYDPIFKPDGYESTFGELSGEVKNRESHRAKAMEKFLLFLVDQIQ